MTYFGPHQVEQVRAKADLAQVIGQYTELKKAGAHFVARCCFHVDATASLHVYPDTAHYFCFGCKASGDVFSVVQQKENVPFQEAVERVAKTCGVLLVDLAASKEKPEDHSRLYDLHAIAADLYERTLWSPPGAKALTYLRDQRKLTDDTIRRHRLGWAPGRGAFMSAAIDAGFTEAELITAQLVGQTEGRVYDLFYDRITVPITDHRSRVIAFTARALPEDMARASRGGKFTPKYINTAESPIFTKGECVFNLARAKAAASKAERLIVMEGAVDVIAADQGGYPECCAPLGTALTKPQGLKLTHAAGSRDLILCLDGDKAGTGPALLGAVKVLISVGALLRVAAVPADTDPAELLVEDVSAESQSAFHNAIGTAQGGVSWLLTHYAPRPADLDQGAKLRVFDQLCDLVRNLTDPELRDLYHCAISKHLGIALNIGRQRIARLTAPPAPAAPKTFTTTYELNEDGNARRFRDRYGNDVVYCETWGLWLVWQGTHWQMDERALAVDRLMVASIDDMQSEILACDNPYLREDLQAWRTKNKNERAIRNSLERLKPLLAVKADRFDADPWLFTVANGTLNLKTGELHAHDRAHWITRICSVPFDPAATDQAWIAYLASLTDGDADLAAFLQRAAGYSMTGITKHDAMFMLAGLAGAGKSTLPTVIMSIMGTYARTLPFELFLASHADRRKWSLAETSQCRMVVCEESEEGKRFNASLVKQVTGGTQIEAERKNGHPFCYQPRFKVWFVCNDKPYVSDTDDGFWRRMHLVWCGKLPEKKNVDLREYLSTDPAAQKAVLAWLVAGAVRYVEHGLAPPAAVLNANQGYRSDQDPLRDFIAEVMFFDPDTESAQVSVSNFMLEYKSWCQLNGVDHPVSKKSVSQRLVAKGVSLDSWSYDAERRRSVRAYQFIRLRRESDPRPSVDGSSFSSPQISPQMSSAPATSVATLPADGQESLLDAFTKALAIASAPKPVTDFATDVVSPQIENTSVATSVATPTADQDSSLRQNATDVTDFHACARVEKAPSSHITGERTDFPPICGETCGESVSPGPLSPPPTREPGADEDEPPWPGINDPSSDHPQEPHP